MRVDTALVERGLARSRAQARQLVVDGLVSVQGETVTRPSQAVTPGDVIELLAEPEQWVGRGALKLLHALAEWGPTLTAAGRHCLDVGASTGGFTQVLLEHGAHSVLALDVGHGQLVEALRTDDRVTDLPGTNIRYVTPADLAAHRPPDGRFDLVVADLSFISLTLTLAPMAKLMRRDGDLVVLVKPQFEVGRDRLGHGGIVTSEAERHRALAAVADHARSLGLVELGRSSSPITGTDGNVEYLLWLRWRREPF